MKHRSNEVKPTQLDRLAAIWAIVEARKRFPTTIMIAGAIAMDDTEAIARGLAQVAHEAGQRAGYLRLSEGAVARSSAGSYAVLTLNSRGSQREAFDAMSTVWRTMFDVVIVDAPVLALQVLGAHIARLADGIVLGIGAQRRVTPADRELAALLTELDSAVIGAVFTGRIPRPDLSASLRERTPFEAAAHQT